MWFQTHVEEIRQFFYKTGEESDAERGEVSALPQTGTTTSPLDWDETHTHRPTPRAIHRAALRSSVDILPPQTADSKAGEDIQTNQYGS